LRTKHAIDPVAGSFCVISGTSADVVRTSDVPSRAMILLVPDRAHYGTTNRRVTRDPELGPAAAPEPLPKFLDDQAAAKVMAAARASSDPRDRLVVELLVRTARRSPRKWIGCGAKNQLGHPSG
jgi:hypothetical protein